MNFAGKTVWQASFQKPQLQSFSIFFYKFVHQCLLSYFLCYSYLLLTFGAVILMFHSIWWQFPLFRLWLYSRHSFFKTVSEKRLIVPLKCARRFLILVQIKLMSITSREVRVEIIKLRCQKDLRNGKLKRSYFLTLDTTSSSGKGEKKGNKR